jgi:NADP-dependent 3-hydroxy acid dehydrogenase YdfG
MAVAVVTGAASGIGREVCLGLLQAGWHVAAIDIDNVRLADLDRQGAGALMPCHCDVRSESDVAKSFNTIIDRWKGVQLLVNSAGIAVGGSLTAGMAPDAKAAMNTNYFGTLHCVEAVLPAMMRAHEGTIVNIASLAGLIPCPGMGAYAASKAAVVAYSEVLAVEAARFGLRVRCVCPAAVDTPFLEALVRSNGISAAVLRVLPPRTPAEIAQCILRAADGPRHLVTPGWSTAALWYLRRLSPAFTRRVLARYFVPSV